MNGLSTCLHFSTKVIYTLVRRSTTPQRLHNLQQPKSKLFTVQLLSVVQDTIFKLCAHAYR